MAEHTDETPTRSDPRPAQRPSPPEQAFAPTMRSPTAAANRPAAAVQQPVRTPNAALPPPTPLRADKQQQDDDGQEQPSQPQKPVRPHPSQVSPSLAATPGGVGLVRISNVSGQKITVSVNNGNGPEEVVLQPRQSSQPVPESSLTEYTRGLAEQRGLVKIRSARV